MLVDPPQPAHANLPAELRKHPRVWELSPQPGEPSPSGLFWQLGDDQVQGMGGGQHRQQVRAPELGGAQAMPPSAGEGARSASGDEVIWHVVTKQFEQGNGSNRRQRGGHA
jgi:hypothetical protein